MYHQKKIHKKQKLSIQQLQTRLHLPPSNPQKVYLGIYLNNQRRKKKGGKIRCDQIPNKIQVYARNIHETLHQCIVYWNQMRRYSNKNIKLQQINQPKPKYIQKKQEFKEIDEDDQQQGKQKQNQQQQKQGKDQQSESDQFQENKFNQLQTIVGRILMIKQNPYKQLKKPIVCTLRLMKKSSNQDSRRKQSMIQSIHRQYWIDGIPINNKLQIFNIQNLGILEDKLQGLLTKTRFYDRRNQLMDILQSYYFLIHYKSWKKFDQYPTATLIQILSKIKTPSGQCQAFLHQFQLTDYLNQIAYQPIPLQPTQLHKKWDKLVFTIDPATSVDLDDALSIQKLQNGNYEVGVHIADVSSYLKLLDRDQLSRISTSVYLPHKVLHMLPNQFVKICTLKQQQQRLAFTVFIQFDSQANILAQRYQKLIIKSRCQFSYENAQQIIQKKWVSCQDFPSKFHLNQQEADQIIRSIKKLNKLAKKIRLKRTKIDIFNNTDIRFQLDQNNYPISIQLYQRKDAHKMVQQFMILANHRVATKLVKQFGKNSLLIHHPPPGQKNIHFLNKSFQQYGIIFLEYKKMPDLEKKIIQQIQKGVSPEIQKLLVLKVSRSQQLASYKSFKQQNLTHFALNLEAYTHFTSPMRRFADIIVHEQLLKCLLNQKINESEEKRLQKQIKILNQKRQATKRLKVRLVDSFFCLFIQHQNRIVDTDGILHSFGLSSLTIFLPEFNMMKQILWRQQLEIIKVRYSKQNKKQLQVLFFDYNKKKQIIWTPKKHTSIKIHINCTKFCPLELRFELFPIINGKQWKIQCRD